MKVSDYITKFLVEKKIKHVFGITGGAIVHLFDSLGKNPDIKYICNLHEQGASIAADAYSRVSENIGVGIATSGPGAVNLLQGICCAYFDSIPTLFLTGQVPTSQLKKDSKSRQIGFQETEIIKMYEPITKYTAIVEDPKKIKYELEKAVYIAKTGRPGPVLLDLPDDVQRAEINPEELISYIPKIPEKDIIDIENKINKIIELVKQAERPIIILGRGVKNSEELTKRFVEKLKFPFVLTWATIDMFSDDYPLSLRDFGVTANRPGNFAVQNSDLVISLGTRLDTHETGNDIKTFARDAKKIVVDIDKSELEKYEKRGLNVDVSLNLDVNDFFKIIENKLKGITTKNISSWIDKIKKWKEKYPICPEEYFKDSNEINPYVFLHVLSDEAKEGDIIIPEAGCNVTWTMQGFKIKNNQKLFTSSNHSPMGYGIPASIGACFANDKKQIITIIGDGGLMMTEQELATIVKHELPIKIFVLNNEGYGMIKQTQETWLEGRYEASTKKSFHIPDILELAKAHGIKKIETIVSHNELKPKIKEVLQYEGPVLCNVKIHPDSRITPKLTFGNPIEDSAPLLDDEEFFENMIVKPLDRNKKKLKEKIKKVLLISPPGKITVTKEGSRERKMAVPPLGLASLAASLKEAEIEVEILDVLIEDYNNERRNGNTILYGLDNEEIKKRIIGANPDMIGISCLFSNRSEEALNIAKISREIMPYAHIVIGGQHPSGTPEIVLKDYVDYILKGEAEDSLKDLIQRINEKRNLKEVDGIILNDNGKIFNNKKIHFPEVNSLPFPAWDLINLEKYWKAGMFDYEVNEEEIKKSIVMFSSRGCPHSCSFCTSKLMSGYYRPRKIENIISEIKFYKEKYGIKEVHFWDDNFFMGKERIKELLNSLIINFPDIKFQTPSGSEINCLDEEIIELLKKAGFEKVFMPVESPNEEIQDEFINKKVKLDRVSYIVKKIQDAGMIAEGSFMVGFPGETKEQIDNTFDMATKFGFDRISIALVNPLPGTPLYEKCKNENLLYGDFNPQDIRWSGENIKLPGIERGYLQKRRREVWLEYMKNKINVEKYEKEKVKLTEQV